VVPELLLVFAVVKYTELSLHGAYKILPEPIPDHRGFFARTWDEREFAERKLEIRIAQCNVAFNARRGTVRGMHYQRPPHEEVKLVRCTRGAILDVIVDLRPASPTRLQWEGVELTAENRVSLYVPGGFAHGYQTLADDTEVSYQVSEFHHPESEAVLLWNDPAVGIKWPIRDVVISDKDRTALPLPAGA
jgi:dTDP-4-dehydrorhamnose 3,5-epimerase